ncbi:MAG TPA: hypothetical protein VGC57_17065 [Cellulomonas sp.]
MTVLETLPRGTRPGTAAATSAPVPGPGADGGAEPDPWITATVCPAGSFGRADAGRLRQLLDALSACASIVVLDLRSARLRSRGAAAAVDDAATALEDRGGCLLCVHADGESRAHLAEAGRHVVILEDELPPSR